MSDFQDNNLEDLLHRFDQGDRSPWLLNRLNILSWRFFHAPWEKPPKPLPVERQLPTLSDFLLDDQVADQNALSPLSIKRCSTILQNRGVPLLFNEVSGGLQFGAMFQHGDEEADIPPTRIQVDVQVTVIGEKEDILHLELTTGVKVPRGKRTSALGLINSHNETATIPRALLRSQRSGATIVTDATFPFDHGVSDAALEAALVRTIAESGKFWVAIQPLIENW